MKHSDNDEIVPSIKGCLPGIKLILVVIFSFQAPRARWSSVATDANVAYVRICVHVCSYLLHT